MYDFSSKFETKQSAKQTLFNIGIAALVACSAPRQINFLGIKFNIETELRKRINQLTEAQAEAALEKIKNELQNK